MFFLLLTSLLTPVCLVFSARATLIEPGLFVALFLLMEVLLVLAFTSLDLLTFYAFFEGILIPMFLIVGVWGSRSRKIHAAYYLFYYTLGGSVLLLLGILYLYSRLGSTHTYHLIVYGFSSVEQLILWALLFFGLSVKVPVIPFHIWLPEAHVEAPTGGSVMLAGLLLKLGGYGFIRFVVPVLPYASAYFTPVTLAFGVVSVVYSSCATLRQLDLKKLIAYSSVAHMGLGLLGLFSLNQQAVEGALALMVGHGLVSGGLFLMVGMLYDRYHTRSVRYYGGLAQPMPLFALVLLFFSLANMGLPGTSNFVGEILILIGLFSRSSLATLLSAGGLVLAAAYSLWLYNRISFGSLKFQHTRLFTDLTRFEVGSCLLLGCLSLGMGVYPSPVLESFHSPSSWGLTT